MRGGTRGGATLIFQYAFWAILPELAPFLALSFKLQALS
jgi:hypothetical protein